MYDSAYSASAEAATYLGRYLLKYKRAEVGLFLDGINDGARVLDYGCNDGWVSREVKYRRPQCEVSGADINPAALAKARRRRGGIEYFDARNGDLDGKTFDVVILSHVLEHVHARLEFLERLVGLIAPGGRLIISVPQERIRGDSTLLPWAMSAIRGRFVNPHVVVLRHEALRLLLLEVGFEIGSSTYTNLVWPRVSRRRSLQSHSLIVQAERVNAEVDAGAGPSSEAVPASKPSNGRDAAAEVTPHRRATDRGQRETVTPNAHADRNRPGS